MRSATAPRRSAGDPRQAVRIRRFLIAAISYGLGAVLIALGVSMGYADLQALFTFLLLALLVNGGFYAAFRSGLNLKAADPSLTAEQILVASACALYIAYHAGEARGIVLMWVLVIFMFGLLRLTTARLLQLAAFALLCYGGVIWLLQLYRPEQLNLRLELLQLAVLGGALVWFAFMGGYISGLRSNLRRSEAFYRAMWQTTIDAVVVVGEDARIRYANPAVTSVFGYSPEQLIGMQAWALRAPEERQASIARFQNYLATGIRGSDWRAREVKCLHRDGHEFQAEISIGEMDIGGERAFLYFARDVTETHAARQRIERMNAELEVRVRQRTAKVEGLLRELETFTYSAAHDLRTPLGVMSTHAGMVLHEFGAQLPEDGRRMLGRIAENAALMANLLEDLLSFARLGEQSIDYRQADMQELAEQSLRKLLAAQAGGNAETAVAAMPACRGDPSMLRQVWTNLLSNALKYTRTRAAPRIEAGYRAEAGAYFVHDNGVGFDMQYADKLFNVFERLHRDERFEGTGVGLAIAARIVRRHGGRIWAEARPDEGASFYFTIP